MKRVKKNLELRKLFMSWGGSRGGTNKIIWIGSPKALAGTLNENNIYLNGAFGGESALSRKQC